MRFSVYKKKRSFSTVRRKRQTGKLSDLRIKLLRLQLHHLVLVDVLPHWTPQIARMLLEQREGALCETLPITVQLRGWATLVVSDLCRTRRPEALVYNMLQAPCFHRTSKKIYHDVSISRSLCWLQNKYLSRVLWVPATGCKEIEQWSQGTIRHRDLGGLFKVYYWFWRMCIFLYQIYCLCQKEEKNSPELHVHLMEPQRGTLTSTRLSTWIRECFSVQTHLSTKQQMLFIC